MKAFALFLAYLACLFGLPAASLTAAASGAQAALFVAASGAQIALFTASAAETQATYGATEARTTEAAATEAQVTEAAAPASAAENAEQKVICLTFDDGPTDSTTPKVLDILDTFGVRATFFLIGRQISGREDIVRRTAAAGHAVGIHTYSHVYREIYASPQALLRDIAACRKAIRAALPGYEGKLYRFPGGEYGKPEALRRAVREAGLTVCAWNASADDSVLPHATADELFENAVRTGADRQRIVLLLHDGVNYRATVACLPRIIRHYKARGYRFETLQQKSGN